MQIDLSRGDVKTHIRTLAVPASIGFFFHTLFNVTDTYFAGMISTQALAALSLSFPIFFLIVSIAGGMSEAVTALIGNALGEGNGGMARHIAMNALVMGAILAVVLTLTGLAAAPVLMRGLGAEGAYLTEALGYINIIITATLFFVFNFYINAMLNAMGDTVSFRNVLVVSALLNVLLDYWFVNGGMGIGPMGVEGIAFATVLIEALSLVYLWYRLSRTMLLRVPTAFRLDRSVLRELFEQGVPPSFNMALTAAGIYIITYFAAPYGQEVVAAYGVGMRIEQIVLMPAIGLNVAVLAMTAQNNGAREHGRIREALDAALGYGALLALLGGGILLGGADIVMDLFSRNKEVVEQGVVYLRIEALVLYPFVMIFTYLAMLQGIKKPKFIFYISLARQIVAPVLLLWLLSLLDLGVLSIWIGIAAIVTMAALLTRWYARRELERLEHLHGIVHR